MTSARLYRFRLFHRHGIIYFAVTVCPLPAVLGNIKDDAVGVLELAFKIALPFVSEIKEKTPAVRLDALLSFDKIVDLKAEMVSADEATRILEGRKPCCPGCP